MLNDLQPITLDSPDPSKTYIHRHKTPEPLHSSGMVSAKIRYSQLDFSRMRCRSEYGRNRPAVRRSFLTEPLASSRNRRSIFRSDGYGTDLYYFVTRSEISARRASPQRGLPIRDPGCPTPRFRAIAAALEGWFRHARHARIQSRAVAISSNDTPCCRGRTTAEVFAAPRLCSCNAVLCCAPIGSVTVRAVRPDSPNPFNLEQSSRDPGI
jgi:hypothetical protein